MIDSTSRMLACHALDYRSARAADKTGCDDLWVLMLILGVLQ